MYNSRRRQQQQQTELTEGVVQGCASSLLWVRQVPTEHNVLLTKMWDSLYHHYQLDHVLESFKVSAPAYAIGKVSFSDHWLDGIFSFEDIKSSILPTGACDTTTEPWSRNDRCFEHKEEEEISVNSLINLLYSCPCVFPQKPCLCHWNDSHGRAGIICGNTFT